MLCGCYSLTARNENLSNSPSPNTPGHEIVGDIAAVGDGEKKFAVGDQVGAGWHGGHDGILYLFRIVRLQLTKSGICRECNRAEFHLCVNREINGLTRNGGCTTVWTTLPRNINC